MKLIAPIISLTAIASARFTKRAALDNLGTISFGSDGVTFNLADGKITLKRENGKFNYHSRSKNGDSYSKMSFDKNTKRWEAEIDWDKNDLPESMYNFYTETMDYSENKCKWNTMVWSEWFECNENGCEGNGSGAMDGVATSKTININWSCNDDSKTFSMVNNFVRPSGVCADNEHLNQFSGESSITWKADKNDKDVWTSNAEVKKGDFIATGRGTFNKKAATVTVDVDGMKAGFKVVAIGGVLRESKFYKITINAFGTTLGAQLPGRKQLPVIKEAVEEQYGWIKQVGDLIMDAPVANGARFVLWSDYATAELENEFDCSSVVEATGIKTNFAGFKFQNAAKDGCAAFNTAAVTFIKDRANEKAPWAREQVGFMLDPVHDYNVNLGKRWAEIFA